MKCLYCGKDDSKVVDSRPSEDGLKIRRRRECLYCHKRFTTYESFETVPTMVIKKDNSREVFNKKKLLTGILRACEKRPISAERLEQMIEKIEIEIQNTYGREIKTSEVGELVLKELKEIDEVAYVRFASVYQEFDNINSFMEILKEFE